MLDHLDQFEFCRLQIRLDLLTAVHFHPALLLELRGALHRIGRQVLGGGQGFNLIFDPPVPAAAFGTRRFQRPGPAFVMAMPSTPSRLHAAGESLLLDLSLFGAGIRSADDFIAILTELGRSGLVDGAGHFEIGALSVFDAAGRGETLALNLPIAGRLPIISARWYLENQPESSLWRLTLASPARLLAGGRPLFRGTLQRVVPFIMRRVTSMAYAHCGAELVRDPQRILAAGAALVLESERFRWQDWRALDPGGENIDLGGLVGAATFSAPADEDLVALLQLGSLLGVGKRAAYGAGHLRLEALAAELG